MNMSMEAILQLVLLLFLSYVTGSLPTSIIVSRIYKGIDIREHGSGNAGGTNVFRVLGWKPALIVALLDVFKGWLPTAYYATQLFQGQPITDPGTVQILCGFATVLGHTYTLFAQFKGGKGIATLLGMLIALFPAVIPLCILVWLLALFTTGYVSVGSILAAASLPFFLLTIPPLFNTEPASLSIMVFSLFIPWFVIFTHRSNISRLRNGTENRFEKAMLLRRKK